VGNNQILQSTVAPIDPVTVYGFPATADVHILGGGTKGIRMFIWYAGPPDALFANAPSGTVFTDETNNDTWVMNVAGSWAQT
jgi:hypothetical protein